MEGNAITRLVKPVFALPGVVGVAVYDRGQTVFDSLPGRDDLSDALRKNVSEFFEGYARVNRQVSQAVIQLGAQTLFLAAQGDLKIVVLARDPANLDDLAAAVLRAGSQLVADPSQLAHAANGGKQATRVRILRWTDCEKQVTSILSKVVSSSQAERMLGRELDGRRISRDQPVTAEQIRSLVETILEQIPMRSKRDLLRSEFASFIQEVQP